MQRSWVVTIALCLAGIAGTWQITHASERAAVPAQAAASPAAATPAKQGKKAVNDVVKTGHAATAHLTMPDQVTWGEAPPALPGAHRQPSSTAIPLPSRAPSPSGSRCPTATR